MSKAFARAGVLIQLVVLLIGTQMPGSWRDGAVQRIGGPVDLSALAHVTLFAGMALLLPWARWWRLQAWHTPLLGLALALLTEGLQFFAVDRHPNLAGLAQDMTGTLLGWTAAAAWWQVRAQGAVALRRLRRITPLDSAVPSTTTAPHSSIQGVTVSPRKSTP